MVKQRPYHKKLKKVKTIMYFALAVVLIIGAFMFYSQTTAQEMLITQDLSVPPTHTDFASFNVFINEESGAQQLTFVQDTTLAIKLFPQEYDLVKTNGIYYYAGDGSSLVTGKGCSQQQLIRFTFCDSAFDKTSCNTDIFANLWLVNTFSDYPNFAEYYTSSQGAFYYTYSCYESDEYFGITVPDVVEKKYLYNDQCITSEDPNWVYGINYNTEQDCLEALEEKLRDESGETCEVKTFDEFACKTDNLYQKVQNADCSVGFTEFERRCDYGCSGGACLPKPSDTCDYLTFNEYQCIGDVKFQQVQEKDCDIGFFLPVGDCDIDNRIEECEYTPLNEFTCITNTVVQKVQMTTCDTKFNKFIERCDLGCQDGACIGSETEKETVTPPEEEDETPTNETIVPPKDDEEGEDKVSLTCKAYQTVKDDECVFSFKKIWTTQGLAEYWDDEPLNLGLSGIVGAGLVALLFII